VANELLARHGLHDWTFAFNRRKSALGLCLYHLRTIELSVYLIRGSASEEILDTLLHEISHALVGPGHGHDAVWKRKCLEIGAKPVRCGEADMPIGRWRANCGQCGKSFHRHRRPKKMRGWYCQGCGPEKGNLTWTMGA
jgi:predicted SprT family Zn-dependent metalloprotease